MTRPRCLADHTCALLDLDGRQRIVVRTDEEYRRAVRTIVQTVSMSQRSLAIETLRAGYERHLDELAKRVLAGSGELTDVV